MKLLRSMCRWIFPAFVAAALLSGCVHFPSHPGAHRKGTVVDERGTPVANATVDFYRLAAPAGRYIPREMALEETALSDERGAFEFPLLDEDLALVVRRADFAPAWRQVWRREARDAPALVTLARPTEVAGRVVTADGHPVAGAVVRATEVSRMTFPGEGRLRTDRLTGQPARRLFKTRTAEDGQFRLTGFPPDTSANLTLAKPGLAMREPGLDPDPGYSSMHCQSGQRDITLIMEPAAEIKGRLFVQSDGRPLEGAKLWLRRSPAVHSFTSGLEEPVESGRDGDFRFTDVGPGSYDIIVRFESPAEPEPKWVADAVHVTVAAGQEIDGIEIPAIRGGLLEVTVADRENRKPIADAFVAVDKREYVTAAPTDRKGRARFRLPPGDYHFSAVKSRWSGEQGKAVVKSGGAARVAIELTPPRVLTGAVHDPSGAPASNVRIDLHPAGVSDETRTDEDGRFQLTWNARRPGRGPSATCVVARDWTRRLAAVSVIDSTATHVNLHLAPSLTLAGRVIDENGAPIPDARQSLTMRLRRPGNSQSGLTVTPVDQAPFGADAEGRFEYSALPQGFAYGISVRARGHGPASRKLEPDETKTDRLDLELTLRTANLAIAGRVMDAEGGPLAGVQVNVSGRGQPYRSVQTDSQGRFECRGLCAGEVRVFSSHQGSFANVSATVGDTNVALKIAAKPKSP